MTEEREKSLKKDADSEIPSHINAGSYTLGLHERGTQSKPEVILIPGFDPQDVNICGRDTRVSVLYPVDIEGFRIPESRTFSITFLAPKRPLDLISALEGDCRKLTLFGCGMCSVVLIAPDRSILESIVRTVAENLYAWERWDIVDKVLENCEDNFETQRLITLKQLDFSIDANLSHSTTWLIDELFLNLTRFYQNAQRYAPFVVEEIEALANDVNEIIAEIRRDEDRQQCMYETFSLVDNESLHQAHVELFGAKKRLNANVDLLVQLNSALVYAVSQAFAGCIPIRQSFPHISHHSLLGTGTAWRAVQRVCSSIFSTFRDASCPEKLREYLEEERGDAFALGSDQELSELRLNTRVVHFSTRSGFGESDAAITCPSQTLQVCDQPEWSLCTTTHEILHAHVRELIAAIFCETTGDEVPNPFDESLAAVVTGYRKYLAKSDNAASPTVSPLHRLRYGLLEFAIEYRANIAKAKDKHGIEKTEFDADEMVEVTVTLPHDIEMIFRAFKKSFRLMEETVVHILDLHYFFAQDLELFSDSLWHSWSIVPSVIEKLDWYILRTLLALASTTNGDQPYQRLADAAKILSDSLNKVIARQNGSVIASEVLRRLDTTSPDGTGGRRSSPFLKWLDLLFPACLPLVDLTTKFLLNRQLAREFNLSRGDTLDGEGHFPIDLPNFDTRGIANPIALIHDRLKIGLDSEGMRTISHTEMARRSAWLLLTLSSELPATYNSQPIL